ncbi:MAG: hypothetical protein AAFY88_09625, partial [Acidobacteriota bacterium]
DDQFEAAARPRHDHHGLCQGSTAPHATTLSKADVPSLLASSASVVSKVVGPSRDSAIRPPTRGPPASV